MSTAAGMYDLRLLRVAAAGGTVKRPSSRLALLAFHEIVSVLPSGTVATLLKNYRLSTLGKVKYLIVSVLPMVTVATLLKNYRLATLGKVK